MAATPWRARRAPPRVSTPSERRARPAVVAADVSRREPPHKTGSPAPMSLAMALGGLSLGAAAPLSSRATLGCTDGLRVRGRDWPACRCRGADARAALPTGAGRAGCCGAAAHHADGGSAGTWRRAGCLALGAACRCPAGAHAAPAQIRFTRLGRIKSPFYRLVVMDSRTRRDGRPLEVSLTLLGLHQPFRLAHAAAAASRRCRPLATPWPRHATRLAQRHAPAQCAWAVPRPPCRARPARPVPLAHAAR